MIRRLLMLLLSLGVLGMGIVAAGLAYMWQAPGPLTRDTLVVIRHGSGVRNVGDTLRDQGIIVSSELFEAVVRVRGLAPRLKAGEYAFEAGVPLREVVAKLVDGATENRSVTIPEGWTVKQVLVLLNATDSLKGDMVAPPEGRVFPDTYLFTLGTNRQSLLEGMQHRMDVALNKAWLARDVSLPYTSPEDLLTMASIVQKEAANNDEMPQIAAVFVNRLRKGMKLQSDPTVLYGADTVGNDIRKKDLTEPQPFNTYVFAGLPPTPIANPGDDALMAAARPAATSALYFMASPDRTRHLFSDTYEQHQKHVKAYWAAQPKTPVSTTLPKARK